MVTVDAIREAQGRLAGVVRRTELERSERLSGPVGCDVYLKVESRQRTGSFKIRGAYNKIAQLTHEQRTAGVIAASAGNHAQGVAYAAARVGIRARIVMPEGTPVVKVSETQALGAEVILDGDGFDAAYRRALAEAEQGGAFIHPFDDEEVIAGQGTVALEVLEDAPEVDTFVAPVGGGGLIAGVAVAAHAVNPRCRVIGVEAGGAACMRASLDAGRPVELPTASSIADGIAVRVPGDKTFAIAREHLAELVTVTDAQIARAMLVLMERHKLVVEGAGAAPLAALELLASRGALGRSVALILSGGNVDVNVLARIIDRGLVEAGRSVRIAVTLPDRPGALAKLATVLGAERANILEITHDRLHSDIDVGEAQVDLLLSTRGPEHIEAVLRALRGEGYAPTVAGLGQVE
jgi:threonine dehydratase